MLVEPRQKLPPTDGLMGPARLLLFIQIPLVLAIRYAYTWPGSMSNAAPLRKLRTTAAAPAACGVAALVPVNTWVAVALALLAVSTLVGATRSGLIRPSGAGPRPE